MERTASLGTLHRLEIEQHDATKREWRAEVTDWQAMIQAVATVGRDGERVESDHRKEHKRWQTHIRALRDEVEVERASFDPESAAAQLLEVFTPPDHPSAMPGQPELGGDPVFSPSPRAEELEPAVDDSDYEDKLFAWEERRAGLATRVMVTPLVFGGFEEHVDDEEPPPSRGSSPGSVAESGFMTADGSPRRSSVGGSRNESEASEVNAAVVVFAHPEFGGGGLGAPPAAAAPFPQGVRQNVPAEEAFVHPDFGGSSSPPLAARHASAAAATAQALPADFAHPEFGGVAPATPETPKASARRGGYVHPDFCR